MSLSKEAIDKYTRALTIGEHVIMGCLGLIAVKILFTDGVFGLSRDIVKFVRRLPCVDSVISIVLDHEVKGAVKLLAGGDSSENTTAVIPIPEFGVPPSKLMDILNDLHSHETAAEDGKSFAYTYITVNDMEEFSKCLGSAYSTFMETSNSGVDTHEKMLSDVWNQFMHTNALNPMMYPSLRRFETEIVSMSAWMMNGDSAVAGSLTSGGTESILMAVKTYRDRARKLRPHVKKPNMIVATSIHPAFEKAAHYFDVEIIHVAIDGNCRVIPSAVERAINRNTILLVGSAPQYCHGVVDPIEALSDIALRHGLPLHVDACFGGFMLPWLEKLGYKIPPFDFRVRGVTSISADIHKYGYSSKGASVILYKNAELRSYQYFAYASWPGGLFGSPSLTGSRPGGIIAAAWAAMVGMGQDGYMRIAAKVMQTTEQIVRAVGKIDGLKMIAEPDMTCVCIVSDSSRVNIHAVADVMEAKGWKIERQQLPDSIHMSILPQHHRVVNTLIQDLSDAAKEVLANPDLGKQGSTGMYGMVASIPDKGIIDDFIVKFFGQIYTTDSKKIIG